MGFIEEIRDRLVAQGVGVYSSDIFIGAKASIPGGDGPYLSLTETGGTGSMRSHNGTATARPTLQILARAKTMQAAKNKLKLAFDALGGDKGLHNVTLSGTFYQSVTPRQQPTDLGMLDGNGRPMIAFNIEAEKQPS
jgi:hypothetical protein